MRGSAPDRPAPPAIPCLFRVVGLAFDGWQPTGGCFWRLSAVGPALSLPAFARCRLGERCGGDGHEHRATGGPGGGGGLPPLRVACQTCRTWRRPGGAVTPVHLWEAAKTTGVADGVGGLTSAGTPNAAAGPGPLRDFFAVGRQRGRHQASSTRPASGGLGRAGARAALPSEPRTGERATYTGVAPGWTVRLCRCCVVRDGVAAACRCPGV